VELVLRLCVCVSVEMICDYGAGCLGVMTNCGSGGKV
jgi:hypothetical protein